MNGHLRMTVKGAELTKVNDVDDVDEELSFDRSDGINARGQQLFKKTTKKNGAVFYSHCDG